MNVRKVEFTMPEAVSIRCLIGNEIDKCMTRLSNLDKNCPDDELLYSYWSEELELMKSVYGKLCCKPVEVETEV